MNVLFSETCFPQLYFISQTREGHSNITGKAANSSSLENWIVIDLIHRRCRLTVCLEMTDQMSEDKILKTCAGTRSDTKYYVIFPHLIHTKELKRHWKGSLVIHIPLNITVIKNHKPFLWISCGDPKLLVCEANRVSFNHRLNKKAVWSKLWRLSLLGKRTTVYFVVIEQL